MDSVLDEATATLSAAAASAAVAETQFSEALAAEKRRLAEAKQTADNLKVEMLNQELAFQIQKEEAITEAVTPLLAEAQQLREDKNTIHREVGDLQKQLTEKDAELKEYMRSSHEQRLFDMEKIRKDAAAETAAKLAGLAKDLEDIKTLRDEFIAEREKEMADAGDMP